MGLGSARDGEKMRSKERRFKPEITEEKRRRGEEEEEEREWNHDDDDAVEGGK